MRQVNFLLFIILILPSLLSFDVTKNYSNTQKALLQKSTEEMVLEIRKWYNQIEKFSSQKEYCKEKSIEKKEPFDEFEISYITKVSECKNLNLIKRSIIIPNYESEAKCYFYYRNNELFFAFLVEGNEMGVSEFRVYFNEKKNIRILEDFEEHIKNNRKRTDVTNNSKRQKEVLKAVREYENEMLTFLN